MNPYDYSFAFENAGLIIGLLITLPVIIIIIRLLIINTFFKINNRLKEIHKELAYQSDLIYKLVNKQTDNSNNE